MLRAAGFDCVDLGFSDTEAAPYTLPAAEREAYLRRERALADDAGIGISQMHGPWRWPARDETPQDRAERMEKMTASLADAALLGCPYWVVHPIMPFGTEDIGTGNERATWEMNLAFMTDLLRRARGYGVTICLENMPMTAFSLGAPAQILRFVREMDDEHFKICLDTGHAAVFPGVTPGQALRELGGEVRVLHVHDNDGKHDQHRAPYYGVTDWADFSSALREVRFGGVLSLEVKVPRMPLPEAEAVYRALAAIARGIAGGYSIHQTRSEDVRCTSDSWEREPRTSRPDSKRIFRTNWTGTRGGAVPS